MTRSVCIVSRITQFLHHHLLGLIIVGYLLATLWPGPGLWLRRSTLGHLRIGGGLSVTPPPLLLGFLLLSAGMRVRVEQLRRTLKKPRFVWMGLLANLGCPLVYVILTAL